MIEDFSDKELEEYWVEMIGCIRDATERYGTQDKLSDKSLYYSLMSYSYTLGELAAEICKRGMFSIIDSSLDDFVF